MHDTLLFTDSKRFTTRPAYGNENTFDYFELSAREDVAVVRETLQIWYNVFPDEEKREIKERLKADFYPAFYELAMYTYFKNLGYKLKVHPDLPSSTKHPDFLASKDGSSFYIKLRCLRMSSEEVLLQERLKNILLDSLNRVEAANFLLMIEKIQFKLDIPTKVHQCSTLKYPIYSGAKYASQTGQVSLLWKRDVVQT